MGPVHQSFQRWPRSMLLEITARTTPAVASGRSVRLSSAEILEGVHLLRDDVGVLADGALEELGVLDDAARASPRSRRRPAARGSRARAAATCRCRRAGCRSCRVTGWMSGHGAAIPQRARCLLDVMARSAGIASSGSDRVCCEPGNSTRSRRAYFSAREPVALRLRGAHAEQQQFRRAHRTRTR